MEIIIPQKDVVIQERITRTIEKFKIISFQDNPEEKYVNASIKLGDDNIYRTIALWRDEEYDNIGQWTDTQAIDKIKELI